MRKKFTRRKFLKNSLRSSLVAGSGALAALGASKRGEAVQASAGTREEKGLSAGFGATESETLRVAIDEIIPATDGMPAASEAGGVEYLDRLVRSEPEIRRGFERGLLLIDSASRRLFNQDFAGLSRPRRVKVLAALEKDAPEVFSTLRDSVYEAYYTSPEVWKLIGYEFHPTIQAGPRMKPFDETVLAQVRKKPRLYREVE